MGNDSVQEARGGEKRGVKTCRTAPTGTILQTAGGGVKMCLCGGAHSTSYLQFCLLLFHLVCVWRWDSVLLLSDQRDLTSATSDVEKKKGKSLDLGEGEEEACASITRTCNKKV